MVRSTTIFISRAFSFSSCFSFAIFGNEQRGVDSPGSRLLGYQPCEILTWHLRLDYLGCAAVTLPSLLDWSPVARLVSSTAPHASRTRARLAARTKKTRMPIPAWRVSLAEKVVLSASCVADSGSPRSSSLSAIGSTRYSFGLVPRAHQCGPKDERKTGRCSNGSETPPLEAGHSATIRTRISPCLSPRSRLNFPRQQFIGKAQIGNKMLPLAIGIQSIANSQQV